MPDYSDKRQRMVIERVSASRSKSDRSAVDGTIKRGRPYFIVTHTFCLGKNCPSNNKTVKFYANCPSVSDLGLDDWGWRIEQKRYFMQNKRAKKSFIIRFKYRWTGRHQEAFIEKAYNEADWPQKFIAGSENPDYAAQVNSYKTDMKFINGNINEPTNWSGSKLECGKTTGSLLFNDPCPWASIRETYQYYPFPAAAMRADHLAPVDVSELPAGYAGKHDDAIHVELRPMNQMVPDGVKEKFLGDELDNALGPNTVQTNPEFPLNYDARVGLDYEVRGFQHDVVGQTVIREERWQVMSTYNDTGDSNFNGMWRYKIVESNIETEARPRKNKEIMYDPVQYLGGVGVPGPNFYRKLHLIPNDYVGGPYSTTIDDTGLNHIYDPNFNS